MKNLNIIYYILYKKNMEMEIKIITYFQFSGQVMLNTYTFIFIKNVFKTQKLFYFKYKYFLTGSFNLNKFT